MRNRRIGAAAGICAALLLVGCLRTPVQPPVGTPTLIIQQTQTPSPTLTPTPFKAELVVCTRNEPDRLIGSASPGGGAASSLVMGRAISYGTSYAAQADLLRALPSVADGTLKRNDDGTITATLRYRDDLKWSDGEPFTVADAVLGFKMPAHPGSPAAQVLDAQQSDPLTVTVLLADGAQYPYVPSQPPLPSHVLKDADPAALQSSGYTRMVNPAIGPYYVVEWVPGDHIVFDANPFYKPQPQIPVVRIRFIADSNQVLAGANGDCDVILDDLLTPDQLGAIDQAVSSGGLKKYEWQGSLRDELVMNTYPGADGRVPFFANVQVRQAVAFGFNRASAIQVGWNGLVQLPVGWIPPEHWAAGGGGFSAYTYDPPKAAALLDQAGWQDQNGDGIREYHGTGGDYACQRGKWTVADNTPLAPTLILPDGDPRRAQLAQALQRDLKPLGIGLQVTPVPPETMFNRDGPIQHRAFDLALVSMAMQPDPGGISEWVGADVFRQPLDKTVVHRWQLEQRWLDSAQLVEQLALNNVPNPDNDWQGQNYAGWCNDLADIAIVQANLGFDLNARKGFYAQHEALLAADVPVIPLDYRPRLALSKAYVCGIQPGPYEPLTWNIATWWFDPAGQCHP